MNKALNFYFVEDVCLYMHEAKRGFVLKKDTVDRSASF